MSFFPLDRDILTSSIWAQGSPELLKLWLYLLLNASVTTGEVHDAAPAIAMRCGLPLETVLDGLKTLSSPDPHSRTKLFEGRRLEELPGGGYRLLNYTLRRDKDYSTPRTRRWRQRERSGTGNGRSTVTGTTDTDTNTYTPLSEVRNGVPVEKWKTEPGKETATATEAQAAWESAWQKIDVPEHQRVTWLSPTRGLSLEDSLLTVGVPSEEHGRWIRMNYIGKLQAILAPTRLRFVRLPG